MVTRDDLSKWITVVVVCVFIVADSLTGLLYNLHFPYYRIGLFVKIALVLVILFYTLFLLRHKSIRSIFVALILLLVFWTINFFTAFFYNLEFDFVNSLIVLNRYLLFIILACLFITLQENASFKDNCKKIIEFFFILNNLFIIFGFFFRINLFSSYPIGSENEIARFGYKGLIYGTNEVAGIYIIGLCYFYRQNFVEKEKKKLLLIFTCIACLLTGTKATLLGLILITIYYFFKYRFLIFLMLLIPAFAIVGYVLIVNWNVLVEEHFSFNRHLFETLDLITFLMSGRDNYIIRNFEYMDNHWTFINFFTGDAFLYSETDLLDLYFFFGLGGILYMYFYVKVFFIQDKSFNNFFNFICLMAIAFVAGHIIQSAVVPVFLLLFIFSKTTSYAKNSSYRANQF